jgi:coproporphyrinogen III oxidase
LEFFLACSYCRKKKRFYPITTEQRTWQEIRRGRYVEFNFSRQRHFIWPKTNGRIESILMSLPPHVQWVYDHHPEVGSEEEKLLKAGESS